ncbi:hypothetical protein D1007_40008 [Hordeum vulgare]|nr:hypothetical protein D1007_40008 [Hordeum vulgare]
MGATSGLIPVQIMASQSFFRCLHHSSGVVHPSASHTTTSSSPQWPLQHLPRRGFPYIGSLRSPHRVRARRYHSRRCTRRPCDRSLHDRVAARFSAGHDLHQPTRPARPPTEPSQFLSVEDPLRGHVPKERRARPHLWSAPPDDPAWVQDDTYVVSWLYTRVSPEIFGPVHQRGASAAELWVSITSLFLENHKHQAVFLATEFGRIKQGSGPVISFFARLKEYADRLVDLGQPVSNREQVLNMFCGLHPRLCYAIPILTMQTPPPPAAGREPFGA